jgi:REP element-mobilizing transposase RayT
MNSKESFYCSTCSREFKRKTCFDKHISICSVINNNNDDFIPSQREMYILLMNLNKKYDLLDKKYNTLQNKYNSIVVKNKCTPIDYLKKSIQCDQIFDDFIKSICILRNYIHYLIENNFSDSICYIIIQLIESNNTNCIQCFEEKKDTLYIFNNGWSILNGTLLKNLITSIKQKIYIEFKTYVDENKDKLYEETFSSIYADTMKKIMDENDRENTIIKNKIYRQFTNKLAIS